MEADAKVLDDLLFLHHAIEQTQKQLLTLLGQLTKLTEIVARQDAAIRHLQAGYDGVPNDLPKRILSH